MTRKFVSLLLVGIVATGCSSEKKTDADQSGDSSVVAFDQSQIEDNDPAKSFKPTFEYEMSGILQELVDVPVEVAGIAFTPAVDWKDLGASGMRAASFTFGPLDEDKDSATVAVYYFGKDKGGTIEDNLERWINQCKLPDGRDAHTGNIQYTLDVDGMKVHMLTVYGFYEASASPMSGESITKENYRFVGSIVEGPEGNLFFKLTGPDFTARVMIEAYMAMIKSMARAS